MKEKPHSKPFRRGEYPLEFIHFDIKGPLPAGIHGERYLLVVVDDATSMPGFIAIGQRSDLTDALIYWIERHERPERRCHRARFDQAGENMDTRLVYFFRDRGIQAECTGTEQHQSNGMAEVTIRTLWKRIQSTIASSELPFKYWPYIAEAVAYLRQFEIHPHVPDKTIYEMWTESRPDISHLRPLGSRCMAKATGTQAKISDKAFPCRLLGYQGNSLYKVLKDNGQVVITHNLICLNEQRACKRCLFAEAAPLDPAAPPAKK